MSFVARRQPSIPTTAGCISNPPAAIGAAHRINLLTLILSLQGAQLFLHSSQLRFQLNDLCSLLLLAHSPDFSAGEMLLLLFGDPFLCMMSSVQLRMQLLTAPRSQSGMTILGSRGGPTLIGGNSGMLRSEGSFIDVHGHAVQRLLCCVLRRLANALTVLAIPYRVVLQACRHGLAVAKAHTLLRWLAMDSVKRTHCQRKRKRCMRED
mmetsp:Transcript_37677/g.67555  ORF Transcript_37677/g.67555 Transcript_37677/m.67555 type:complete len:208 (-) Transcript_37677:2-625(-)